MIAPTIACLLLAAASAQTVLFSEDFNELNLGVWEMEKTMGGGGNWEFEMYANNRSNAYVRDGILYIKPTFTTDIIGEANLEANYRWDYWGSSPADLCTGNAFWGCERTSGAGGNYLPPIQSARLRTANTFAFKYGKLEIRAKLPRGDWLWPALWLLPKYAAYGPWPASGEIDLIESRGNGASYPAGGINTVSSTLHFGPFWPLDPYMLAHSEKKLTGTDFGAAFHTFGLVWTPTSFKTYLDTEDNTILNLDLTGTSFWKLGKFDTMKIDNPWAGRGANAPFDQQFYLIMNLAVGGTNGYFPDGQGNKPWSNTDSHSVNAFWNGRGQWQPTWKGEDCALQVDSVRVWSL